MYRILQNSVPVSKSPDYRETEAQAIADFTGYLINDLGWSSEVRYMTFPEIALAWYMKFGETIKISESNPS